MHRNGARLPSSIVPVIIFVQGAGTRRRTDQVYRVVFAPVAHDKMNIKITLTEELQGKRKRLIKDNLK